MNVRKIEENLPKNLSRLDALFLNAVDYTKLAITVGGEPGCLLSLEGQVNKQYVSLGVINPLLHSLIPQKDGVEIMAYVTENVLAAVDQVQVHHVEEIAEKLMLGFAVLLIDGCSYAVGFGVQGFQMRSVQEPSNESMLRGSKEGFVESLAVNLSLVRRRMRTTDLKFERIFLGSQSNTPVLICYLQNRVSQEILNKIKLQLKEVDLQTVMASGYLTGYLKRGGIFGSVGITERPDTVCGKIEEGRVAVMVDGTPTVLLVPYLFAENFQTLDDYANRPFYATFARCIKYIAFFLAGILPGIYVAVITHRPELIQDNLLVKIATEESKTPLSILWELLLVNLLYEIMREASLRAPKVFSQSVSIVGALVIGDTAVSSGLIGAPSLVVIALAAISDFTIPRLHEQLSVLRFVFILIGGFLGPWGIIFSCMF
ncbi:MAG: spore germination protein, partial [Oscillospiraceae bacterium]